MNRFIRVSPSISPALANPALHFDDVFADLFRPATHSENRQRPIRIEVSETEHAYLVSAVLAGVKRDEINVAVETNVVTISAEIKREAVGEEAHDTANDAAKNSAAPAAQLLHSERTYGKTSRRFSLKQEIDEAKVEAKYADGILHLVLPKKAEAAAKRITIQ